MTSFNTSIIYFMSFLYFLQYSFFSPFFHSHIFKPFFPFLLSFIPSASLSSSFQFIHYPSSSNFLLIFFLLIEKIFNLTFKFLTGASSQKLYDSFIVNDRPNIYAKQSLCVSKLRPKLRKIK